MGRLHEIINRRPNRWGNLTIKEFERDIVLLQENCKHLLTNDYYVKQLKEENERLCNKLADIRDLFDESDMKAEGHGMEDIIGSPYAVACYAENKIKRLMKENQMLYGRLNMISDIIE